MRLERTLLIAIFFELTGFLIFKIETPVCMTAGLLIAFVGIFIGVLGLIFCKE